MFSSSLAYLWAGSELTEGDQIPQVVQSPGRGYRGQTKTRGGKDGGGLFKMELDRAGLEG